jgi:hypothetical protein
MSKKNISPICIFILLISTSFKAYATQPQLNFSDLITGPDTGLGDGKGSGVIVTVWGFNLGASQGSNTIEYCDSKSVCRPGHVYYWKNADGKLPGGPANLFESHGMQEIAFSIPDSANGQGVIKVTVNSKETTLPFTVRDGNIYHVTAGGNDSSGNGTFSSPWRTVDKAISLVNSPGSTIYIHNVDSGSKNEEKGIYWNNASASSSLNAQFAFIAYPGTRPTSTGSNGFTNYKVDGQVISKFDIYASNHLGVDSNGQPYNKTFNSTRCFETDRYGRGVGNRCTDIPGGCASGAQGAINGNALNGDEISGYKILGNEVYEYGCEGSSKLHHTTYLSIRSGDANLQVDPWQFGWNYLHDNQAKNGIHNYDENNSGLNCGSPNNDVIINDNVIINQAGAAISIGASCPWTNNFEVYNNVIMNAGLASDWNGVDVTTSKGPLTAGIMVRDGGLTGTVSFFNNTVYKWNDDDLVASSQACFGFEGDNDSVKVLWNNNVCYTNKDKPFVWYGCCGADVLMDNISGSNNVWHTTYNSPKNAVPPKWDSNSINTDPLLIVTGAKILLGASSPAVDAGNNSSNALDVYGVARQPSSDIGAVESVNRPKSPTDLKAW